MRKIRYSALAASALLVGTVVGVAPEARAADCTTGVGTAAGDLTVLSVDLGDLALVDLVVDGGAANINPSAGDTESWSSLTPVSVESDIVGLDEDLGTIESRSSGESNSFESESLSLPDSLAPLATGTLNPTSFNAVVDSAGARSSIDTELVNAAVGGVLLSVDSVTSGLSNNAGLTGATSNRSIVVDSVVALDLSTFLGSLGIPIDSLSPGVLLDILEELGLDVNGASISDVSEQLTLMLTAVDQLDDIFDGLLVASSDGGGDIVTSGVLDDLGDLLDDITGDADLDAPATELSDEVVTLLGDLGIDVPDLGSAAEVLGAIEELTGPIADVLGDIAVAADVAPLLSLEGVDAGLTTLATCSEDASAAGVTAEIGSLVVGNQFFAGVDLLDTAEDIQAQAAAVVGEIEGVLALVDPGLALPEITDIVSVSLLDTASSVETDNGFVTSLASLTAATVDITVPDTLDDIVATIEAAPGVSDLLDSLDANLPTEILAASDALTEVLGSQLALASGGRIQVAQLTNSSTFGAGIGSGLTGDPALAATGAEQQLPLLLGGLALVAALTARRFRKEH